MSFTEYLQVPLNCNQSLTVILTQIRLLHTDGASTSTEDFMHASAQVLSHQMTVSVRSSDLIRALLLSAASADSVTEVNIQMLMNVI